MKWFLLVFHHILHYRDVPNLTQVTLMLYLSLELFSKHQCPSQVSTVQWEPKENTLLGHW